MEQHEQRVAERCQDFLGRIDPGLALYGEILGRWHDVGKYSSDFQSYLKAANDKDRDVHSAEVRGRVDHSTAGAQNSSWRFNRTGNLFANCIAGHHAGLPDWISQTSDPSSGLSQRLKKPIPDYSAASESLLNVSEPPLPDMAFDHGSESRLGFQLSLLTRFCFSALCDADFLATESFMSPKKSALRPTAPVSMAAMRNHLRGHMEEFSRAPKTKVNQVRNSVLDQSIDTASFSPGLFSLNVPTGGGKTLASLSFALHHAAKHKLDRVIYAIPFTSIIEQTADVFRSVFDSLGEDIVLEHHSNLDPDEVSTRSRLASENWDAPLVVTTNVQFFESLFAAKTSRARKIHRLAKSVIILDEVQTLPVHLLRPCLDVLRELSRFLGSTIVLCTATQPAIEIRDGFDIGLENVRPIIKDSRTLHQQMRRVTPTSLGRIGDDQLISRIAECEKTLCIVNTRPHAARVYTGVCDQTDPKEVFHLSTFMCAAHRSEVLGVVKERLPLGQCRVVSTQLIEAGVDVDFPVVFRAIAGLDSIAQAAGRCNREGKLKRGELFVFDPEVQLRGMLRQASEKAREVIPDFDDMLSLDAIDKYFKLHYWQQKEHWDENGVMNCLTDPSGQLHFQFRSAAERFRMIEETARSVFIPWGDAGKQLEERIRAADLIDRRLRRKLQRYLVPVYENAFNEMVGRDIDIESVDGIPILINRDVYDERLGLRLDLAGQHDPGGLIV